MNRVLEKEEAVDLFMQHMEAELPITDNGTDEEFVPEDGECFVQCYDPEDPVRNSFPARWFVSNYGNLLSVTLKGIKRLKLHYAKNDKAKKYGFYNYAFMDNGIPTNKIVKAHVLVAVVFGSTVYGKTAKQLLQDRGIFAWKDDSDESEQRSVVATHHESKDPEDWLNPEKLETTCEEVHFLLSKVERDLRKVKPKYASRSKDGLANISFMQELSELASREAPEKMTVLFTGETINVVTGEVRYDGLTKIEEHELPTKIELTDNESDNSDNT